MRSKNLPRIAKGALAVVMLLLLFSIWRNASRFMGHFSAMFNLQTSEPEIDPRSLVIDQVRGVSELTTAVYAMESVVPASRDRTLGNYVIGRTTLLYIAYGEVRAGVDLSEINDGDIQINNEALSLRLPPPEILDSKIDVTRSRVYDYDRGFLGLGPDSAPQLQELAQRETLQRIIEAACDNGVLSEANERAESVVTQLLTTAGYQTITIETQPPPPDTCEISGSVALDIQ
ncbi:MAG: DUF4230 domain-containing protein [Elainellaceae cyanobacterium]